MPKDLLLFIAVLPSEEIQGEVTKFKEYALEHFQSGRALRSPPHITLAPPFRWPPGRLVELKLQHNGHRWQINSIYSLSKEV